MLNKHELPVPKEEMEKVDTLRYSWSKLQALASEVSSHLLQIQPNFREELIKDVKTFVSDCSNFYHDYDTVCVPSAFTQINGLILNCNDQVDIFLHTRHVNKHSCCPLEIPLIVLSCRDF